MEYIEYGGVRVTADYLTAMEGRRPVRAILKTEIVGIELTRGSDVERPFLVFLLGTFMVAVGLVPLLVFLQPGGLVHVFHAGKAGVYCCLLLVWLFVGGWIMVEVFRKKIILVVATTRGRKKIAFHGAIDPPGLQDYLRRAETEFGYTFEIRCPEWLASSKGT